MMKYWKIVLLLLLAFTAGAALALFYGYKYNELVRHFFITSTDGNIQFAGKFIDFPSEAFVLSCAVFTTTTAWCLYGQKWHRILLYVAIMVLLFFGATYISSSVDAIGRIAQCSGCTAEEKALRNNNINYELHLLVALFVSILPIARLIPRSKNI